MSTPQYSAEGSAEGARHKRPAWDIPNDRASKRRAAQACLSCRNRKVRCDVTNGGHPCTNCRLDHLECIVKASNRGRKPANASAQPAPEYNSSRIQRPESTSPQALPSPVSNPPPQAARRLSRASEPNDYLISLSFEDNTRRSSPRGDGDALRGNVPASNSNHREHRASISHREEDLPIPSPEAPISFCPQVPQQDPSTRSLPPYIRRLPRHISNRDLKYLADKGALTIPDDAFRDELLRTYITLVYPFMPTIDFEEFLPPIVRGDGRDQVSLLLFQAVMFASVTFIDEKYLQARGFSSRKAARKLFFGRVRLLYGLDCEQDRLALLQAVLLMTYWYDSPNDNKDTWYWMGIALSLAQVIGLHRKIDPAGISTNSKQLRRRIWWSCIMRDRMLALGIRRPSRIRNEDIVIPPLSLEDFDLRDPSKAVTKLMGDSRLTHADPSARAEVAIQTIELSKLCICLGHTLHSQYSAIEVQPSSSDYLSKTAVFPKRSKKQLQDLEKCDAELDEWLSNKDPRATYLSENHLDAEKGDWAYQIAVLHRALLHMVYLTTICVLHKPQVLNSEADTTEAGTTPRKQTSRKRVTDAAIAITNLAFHLQSSNQLRFLSTSSIPAFLSATLIHLLDIRSPDEQIRNISVGRFHQCVSALQELQNMYSSADYAMHFLETVLKKINMNIPVMRPTSFTSSFSLFSSRGERSNTMRPTTSTASTVWKTPHNQPIADRGTTPCRVATAYPSPSSSRNHQLYHSDLPLSSSIPNLNPNHDAGGLGPADDLHQQFNPFSQTNNRVDTWCSSHISASAHNHNYNAGDMDASDPDFLDDRADRDSIGSSIPVPLDPLIVDSWTDFDTLVPGLFNFEDGSSGVAGVGSFGVGGILDGVGVGGGIM